MSTDNRKNIYHVHDLSFKINTAGFFINRIKLWLTLFELTMGPAESLIKYIFL